MLLKNKRSLHDCLSPSAQFPVSLDIITEAHTQTGNASAVVYIIVPWKPIRISFICCSLQVLMIALTLGVATWETFPVAPPLLADLHESYSWRVAWPLAAECNWPKSSTSLGDSLDAMELHVLCKGNTWNPIDLYFFEGQPLKTKVFSNQNKLSFGFQGYIYTYDWVDPTIDWFPTSTHPSDKKQWDPKIWVVTPNLRDHLFFAWCLGQTHRILSLSIPLPSKISMPESLHSRDKCTLIPFCFFPLLYTWWSMCQWDHGIVTMK